MVKRLLSCTASEVKKMTPMELKQAIKASEGRIICSENVAISQSVAGDITNAELASAYGADLILLNGFDVFNPVVMGLPGSANLQDVIDEFNDPRHLKKNPVDQLKYLTGRPVGVNLEPVDLDTKMNETITLISEGRQCSKETLQEAQKLGFDFICLTGNPGTGVTNEKIADAVKLAKEHFFGLVIAGKMHGAGVDEDVVNMEAIQSFVEAGADIVLLPAVGTVPGVTDEDVRDAVKYIRKAGALSMSAIGTSQESADQETVKQIAIRNKICGVDIQHIGDAGYSGLAPVENIYVTSIAIRGLRHTMNRVGTSINR
ncbi:haloacid dehalogenase-like hydrolase [Vagococcus fluvialis]|uniref:DUF7916 family protein n=1 Tax=Vagococcus fluvialis TaxID=2738 RepID=UPI00288F6645|nr:haloacid dehalogenase-like hydrolase [Vagococcus fluvialis]MDT2782741.1 haloacid dehalogenase-like hydrolase [Vagococcus fluvialis]